MLEYATQLEMVRNALNKDWGYAAGFQAFYVYALMCVPRRSTATQRLKSPKSVIEK